MAVATAAQAQKIDFNNTKNITDDGFTPWMVGLATGSISQTVDGVTFTVSRAEGSIGTHLMGEWWKDGVNKYSKLTSDGLTVSGKAGDEKYTLREGAVALTVTIEGLTAGEHSLLAYHNNPAGFSGAPVKVSVDGTVKASGIEQTNRAQTPSASGMSYVKFQAVEGQAVVVTYETVPDPSTDYTQGYNTTSLYINALVMDRPNPKTAASDPTPAHADRHYDGTRLQWTPATLAVRHHVYLGTSPDELAEVAVTTQSSYDAKELSAAPTYYWRVDEEDAQGNVYQGDTWSFRRARLAFPGAEGYGRFAIGGRGGEVYHVTSLDDDATDPLPGTLRYGITRLSGPRTIVFDVSGTISLQSRLVCSDSYVTIAGQTAPGRGIMLRGNSFGISNDNIARFLRQRLGYKQRDDNSSRDGMGINGDHSIMDHCSVGWTIDEAFSSRGSKNVTLQRTLISEALNIADHPNYEAGKGHGYAATIGGDTGSYHHNLLAHNEGRNWSMAGGLDGSGAYAGHHDMFNNVCYNWGNRATDGGTHEGNFVANYYKMGPSTTKTVLLTADLEGTGSGTQSYYVKGNIRENLNGSQTQDALNNTYKVNAKQTYDWTVFVGQPFFESHATIETAQAAYQNVLSDVGCNFAGLDNHDERMVRETLQGTTSTTGSVSRMKGLIDRETDSEGFDGLNITEARRPEGYDTDQDGIPDWFEEARGWSTTTPNNNHIGDGSEYTNLEEYLNWMAQPHFFALPTEVSGESQSLKLDLRPYFAGYTTFSAATDDPQADDGTEWTVSADGQAIFTASYKGAMLKQQTATFTDPQTGSTLTRTFHIAVVNELPATETSLYSAADVNRDGFVDVFDIVALANLIMLQP